MNEFGNCINKFGYVGVAHTRFTAFGYLQIQQDSCCMLVGICTCTEGQATHCSDNLGEVPVVKIEQKLCGLFRILREGFLPF